MKLFGLACEGITDQITIENILCGYFENPNLNEEIAYLQPFLDESDQSRSEGGWRTLLQYLASDRFQQDVSSCQFLILQIDTDISKELAVQNAQNLSVESLIQEVIKIIINKINQDQTNFYEQCANKIIFAICVHSLECWFVSFYSEQSEIHDCNDILKRLPISSNIRITKKPKNYNQLSQPFLIRENIDVVSQKDPSFRIFIQAIESIQIL